MQSAIFFDDCLATIIFEFNKLEVFSKTIFSIVLSSLGSQSKWSNPQEVIIFAKFFFNIFTASNLANNPY